MAVLTLPVERKYCARAITNSWAGTSFTVRGADGMVRARGKKGRTVRVRSKTLKTKGCARTERTFRKKKFFCAKFPTLFRFLARLFPKKKKKKNHSHITTFFNIR